MNERHAPLTAFVRLFVSLSAILLLVVSHFAKAADHEGCTEVSVPIRPDAPRDTTLRPPQWPFRSSPAPSLHGLDLQTSLLSSITIPDLSQSQLDLKVLLLSASDDPDLEPGLTLARVAFQAQAIPYEHRILTEGGVATNEPLELESQPGHGRYYAIVLTNSQLAFQDSSGSWRSAMSAEQWQELANYEAKFKVRQVGLFGYPASIPGLALDGEANGNETSLTFERGLERYTAGIKTGARFPLKGSWHYPAIATTPNHRPFLKYAPDGKLAAVITTREDGTEELNFFFAQSEYVSASLAVAPSWIRWVTRGLYIGKRRTYLNIQVDDLFMTTPLWDSDTSGPGRNVTSDFRITSNDLALYIDWQRNFRRRLPSGSRFLTEFAYNAFGVLDQGTDGSISGYARDSLFRLAREARDEFYWVNHTFTHPNLDRLSRERTAVQLQRNQAFARDLLGIGHPHFSPLSLVPPQISGMFNGEALHGEYMTGIRYLVGDNTRGELNPGNPYHARLTSGIHNGFHGLLIVPRHATHVFFNVTDGALLESQYNSIYRSHWGRDMALPEILSLEAERVLNPLLSFRPDPFMFHQANVNAFAWMRPETGEAERTSLLALWLDTVARSLSNYSTLPILSLKNDDLGRLYEERMRLDACGVRATAILKADAIEGITLASDAPCRVPLTGDGPAVPRANLAERYGPDFTQTFSLTPKTPVSFPFPYPWG